MNEINIDLHCDLLCYLLRSNVRIDDKEIGCSLPYLKEGNVKLQVMAIFTPTMKDSIHFGLKQSRIFTDLLGNKEFFLFNGSNYDEIENSGQIGVVASVENASSFCEEDTDLEAGFKNLETIIRNTHKVLYIGITHHTENRFGGGNNSEAGLKNDGKVLIDYLADKKIAIDLAHTSDQLAYDILNYLDQRNYKIPVLTSHSNYRNVYENPRNLPDELVKELIKREGLIGINFIKDYIDLKDPDRLYEHIRYGLDSGAEDVMAYGGDFFFDKDHPDRSRYPFFFDEFNNASAYNSINKRITEEFSSNFMEKISHKNALNFIRKLWN
ncbi:microsomal dipeptidase-like Zn-dependent dipeptidase [Chryseobacterium defluvii]|uniref:Microsomal dipeptidase-like Zn-dependent dipeptidase n=1 Tax=Chryseobacterium defluvii TaxID=160396 RepID=A0A840K873_9FLAO|nr:membrane dipeptidase [Chryseobacterium defluvii]MBB4805469.1 microsomal dipeptidase-like Zn-dependent dipeptidase [Chryseobacterium defluvii]